MITRTHSKKKKKSVSLNKKNSSIAKIDMSKNHQSYLNKKRQSKLVKTPVSSSIHKTNKTNNTSKSKSKDKKKVILESKSSSNSITCKFNFCCSFCSNYLMLALTDDIRRCWECDNMLHYNCHLTSLTLVNEISNFKHKIEKPKNNDLDTGKYLLKIRKFMEFDKYEEAHIKNIKNDCKRITCFNCVLKSDMEMNKIFNSKFSNSSNSDLESSKSRTKSKFKNLKIENKNSKTKSKSKLKNEKEKINKNMKNIKTKNDELTEMLEKNDYVDRIISTKLSMNVIPLNNEYNGKDKISTNKKNKQESKSKIYDLLSSYAKKCTSKNYLYEFNNICTMMFKNYYIEKEKFFESLKSNNMSNSKSNLNPSFQELKNKFIPLSYFILIRNNNNPFINLLKNGLNNKGSISSIFEQAEKIFEKKHGNSIENSINKAISVLCKGISLENLEEYLGNKDDKHSNIEKIYPECKIFIIYSLELHLK